MDLSSNVQKVFDLVKDLSVIELNELVKALEEEFGVSAAPVMVAGWAAAAGDEGWDKDSFNVELTEIGQQKIAVIKVVRAVTGLGLADAKKLTETADAMIKENVKKEEADELKKQLEEAGATVEVK